MPKEKFLELKIGVFVLVALVCLSGFIFSISDFSVLRQGKTMHVVFGFVNGLKVSSPVRFAGVDAGLVKDLTLFYDRETNKARVRVDVWLEQGHEIPKDSTVFVNQLGLLGEKYLEIMPGTADEVIREGGTLIGEDPIAMEHISRTLSQITDKVSITLDDLNNGLLKEENIASLERSLHGMDKLLTNINEGKGTIGRFMTDAAVYNNMEELTADLKANPWKLFYRPKQKK